MTVTVTDTGQGRLDSRRLLLTPLPTSARYSAQEAR